MKAEEPVYGLVRFEGDGQRVKEIVVAFETAGAADRYAREVGWSEYGVGPVRFPASVQAADVPAAVA
ncbi:hypothetical protein [Frankia sp. BMG5.23]|uniref:hypothetical protein n=1 Tax=Frankia sp. BMG5.23 TaxID=683305 RepID=UPI00046186C9|nr:hypothetical protein [Frankia sp. BMG5.23]KDA40824.1 hypothetical protein BMG523Draft_04368 [Frankia sp. BMG5.23]